MNIIFKIQNSKFIKKSFFDSKKRISFYKIFSAYLKDGISIQKTLEICYKKFNEEDKVFGYILKEFIDKDKSGKYKNFGLIIKDYISEEEFTLLSTSKNSTLSSSMEQCIFILETKETIKKTLKGYVPSLFKLSIGYFSLLGIYNIAFKKLEEVINEMKVSFPDIDVDVSIMDTVSNILYIYSPSIFGLILLYIILAFNYGFFIKNKKDADKFHNFPVLKTIREIKSVTFLMSLYSQIKNNISIKQSIKNIKDTNNDLLTNIYLREIDKNISSYKSEGVSLKVGFFNKNIENDIEHYAKLSGFTKTIEIISKNSIENLLDSIKKSTNLFGLISLFGMVGYISLIIYTQMNLILTIMKFS